MTIKHVYQEFQIPRNLQAHMLRVASLLKIMGDSWQGEEIDWEALVQAGLFHDIAKPINFDLNKQAQFGMNPGEVKNLKRLQIRIKREFGEKEHEACIEILLKMGGKQRAGELLDNLEWEYIERLWQKKDIESLMLIYADMRIGPSGIMFLENRLQELKQREPKSLNFEVLLKYALMVERMIQSHIDIKIINIQEKELEVWLEKIIDWEILS